jgi:dienelactone hydrolase
VSKSLERLFKSPEVKRKKLNMSLSENYFTNKRNNITIVVLGGSDGNSDALTLISALLASHGFNVLSLAYFNEKGLPKKLAEIPLEYFERVFQWIEKNQMTSGNDIYIHGTSKGGELALLLASRYPMIKKVVAFAPHGYCFQGLNHRNVSSWQYKGEDIPFIRIKNSVIFADVINCFIKNKPFGYTKAYRKALDTATNKHKARIKVEDAKADLLLIAGEEDNIWNACDGCHEIINTLEKHNYKYDYKLLAYEHAGHPFPLPYMIPVDVLQSMKVAPRLVFAPGGTMEGNAQAQSDSWSRTIEFFGLFQE